VPLKKSQLGSRLKDAAGYRPHKAPECPYCGSTADLCPDSVVYGRSFGRRVWVCQNYPECDSYVGVHFSTDDPLGRLANKELRERRIEAHAWFDPIWKAGDMSRAAAYRWLAKAMQMPVDDVHIGQFDLGLCEAVIEICRGRNA
jgi:ssDNA-binding Zn-finger/Zn-ribbon topoisomerase 1